MDARKAAHPTLQNRPCYTVSDTASSGEADRKSQASQKQSQSGINIVVGEGQDSAKIQIGKHGIDIEGKDESGSSGKIEINARTGISITGRDPSGGDGQVGVNPNGSVDIYGRSSGNDGRIQVNPSGNVEIQGQDTEGTKGRVSVDAAAGNRKKLENF